MLNPEVVLKSLQGVFDMSRNIHWGIGEVEADKQLYVLGAWGWALGWAENKKISRNFFE